MKIEELSKYYKLKKEIEDLTERIEMLGDGLGALKPKELEVSSSHSLESVQEKIILLKDLLMEKRVSALEEYIKIENYISTVNDPEIRVLMRKRFMDLLSWTEIDNKLHYSSGYSKVKLNRYLKERKIDNV